MKALMNKIARLLCLTVTTVFVTTLLHSAPRKYPNSGTIELEKVYHVDRTKDKILKELGYTQAMLPDSFPAFTAYWTARGWPVSEMLDLYLFECAWNDAVWINDTYVGLCCYIRPNFVTQSRAWIIAPDGWYRVRYGCMTGLGRYSGKLAQVYSDRSGNNPGCTPGTAIEIDHAGWSIRQPDRVCLNSTAWGKDYGVIGGLAYTEGIIIEYLRLVGSKSQAGTFAGLSTGVTMNEPGENSVIRYCMAENFKGAGYTIFNGTPFVVETCSAFNNDGPGFDLLGSNGLCNVRLETPSGDNNKVALLRIKPKDAQSVGGGTITVRNMKSESRNTIQIPIVIEGAMGDLNLIVDGMTANFEGVTCPYLIGGNWTGNQFEISARGIDLRSNTTALFSHGGRGWTLTGGKAYSGNSFTVNDEGLAFRSRANMVLNGGPTTPPPGPVDPPPTSGTMTATAFASTAANPASNAVDGSAATFWMSGQSMASGQTFTVDYGVSASRSSVSFDIANGYLNSYPRTFDVQVSTNGTTWTTAKAGATGAYPTCTATFSARTYRYVRVTCKTANSNWWTIQAWR